MYTSARIPAADRALLRELAKQAAQAAADPIQEVKRHLWTEHDTCAAIHADLHSSRKRLT